MTTPYPAPKNKTIEKLAVATITITTNDRATRPRILLVSILLTAIATIIYLGMFSAIYFFDDMFRRFGVNLPAFTQFIVSIQPIYVLLAVLGWRPCRQLSKNKQQDKGQEKKLFSIVVFNLLFAFVSAVITLIGLYLPTFKLGSAI